MVKHTLEKAIGDAVALSLQSGKPIAVVHYADAPEDEFWAIALNVALPLSYKFTVYNTYLAILDAAEHTITVVNKSIHDLTFRHNR